MTNKEFFLKVLDEETPKFRAIIEALPEDKHGHKVHDKSREAGNLASQLAMQWQGISGIVTQGAPTMNAHTGAQLTRDEMLAMYDQGIAQLKTDVQSATDDDWENSEASMGPEWKTKKYDMAWGFLFDAIHHRGQLMTYLRNMGARVPGIYGPSADDVQPST